MANIIEVKDLVYQYPQADEPAINKMSISFEKGSFNYILGSNGSGKSTLLKCLAGIVTWKSGSIYINGIDRNKDRKDFNSQQIFISEELRLPNYSVKQVMELYRKFWKNFDVSIFERVISYSEIKMNKNIYSHSKGQIILIQFGLALATQVPLLIMDEVSAPLDPFVRAKVAEELRNISLTKKTTVLLATNVPTDISETDAQLILIKNGLLIKQASIAAISQEFGAQSAADIFVKFVEQGRGK
jgi:ABC-type multidrug transport system ATPase subunit